MESVEESRNPHGMIIIAAISINSFSEGKIRRIILAGADILRYNFSHSSIEENIDHMRRGRQVINQLNYNVKIMADLPSPKIRLGNFDTKTFSVHEGEQLTFKSGSYSPDCNEFIPVQLQCLGDMVSLNQAITLGDGEIAVQVSKILDSNTIKATILNNGMIQTMKGFNLPMKVDGDAFINHYKTILDALAEVRPHYIAVPFVNVDVNKKMMPILQGLSWISKIAIKIETKDALENLDMICQDKLYSMIIIDRGELGINLPYEELGIIQKQAVKRARQYNKQVIVSTQILESTINNFVPLRSDILDLTNIMLDGANGVMFCKETGFGSRPSYTVSVARKIIKTVTNKKNSGQAL